jgi:CRP-like cAMP-binding protein
LVEGELTDKLFVIRKGLVRGYRVFEGQEVTFWVSIDGDFFTSSNYFLQLPSEEHMECLEDCILDYLTYDHIQYALEYFSDFKAFYLKNFELYYRFAQIRATIARIPNAKSRLDYFFKNYNPEIINRCPDKYLSSFLNVQPETYCRLKKEIL